MKVIYFVISLLLTILPSIAEVLNYTETTDNIVEHLSANITDSSIIIETIDEKHTMLVDNSRNTSKWIILNKKSDTETVIIRDKKFKKNIPWYQSFHHLAPEIVKNSSKIIFYIGSANFDKKVSKGDGIQIMEFKAVFKKEVGNLKLYHITFNDFRSVFWKSKVWFRSSDGVLVNYRDVRGAPGTPETVGNLILTK